MTGTAHAPTQRPVQGGVHFTPPRIAAPERQLPFFREIHAAIDNPMEGWPRAVYEQLVYRPPRNTFPRIYICDPGALKRVMVDDVDDFPKNELQDRLVRPILGEGLLTSAGAQWRWQRQAAAPAFRAARFAESGSAMADAVEAAIARWTPGARIDLAHEMSAITFDILLETMLAGGEGVAANDLSRQINIYLSQLGSPSLADFVGAPMWVRMLLHPEGVAATRYLREAVEGMIARRRKGAQRNDLLNMLMNATDPESGRAMSDTDLRDNLLTFLAAGHETTALGLTWALYLASSHAPTEARILEEIAAVAGDGPIDAGNFEKLEFTRRVVQETLRLFPPVPVLTRVSRKPCELGGLSVKAGETVVIPIYALHRHRVHWDDPDAFEPDRFLSRTRDRMLYMPFGAGRRICIGASLAMMESVIVLATVLRRVRLTHDANHAIRPLLRITMRPEGGMPMQVAAR